MSKKIKKAVVKVNRLFCSSHPSGFLNRGFVAEGKDLEILIEHGCVFVEKEKEDGHLLILEYEEPAKPKAKPAPKKKKPMKKEEKPEDKKEASDKE